MYTLEKHITKLQQKNATFFLDPKEQLELKRKLKKNSYKIYTPFEESEKNIFYTITPPNILLYEIKCKLPLRHQDILGNIFALNMKSEMFGDIIIDKNQYYIYILEQMKFYFETNFLKIKNAPVTLIELPLDTLSTYKRQYEEINIITSSTRIDTVLATLLGTSRQKILNIIKDKDVILNYETVTNPSYFLKEQDIFSIRTYGKYKYIGLIKKTKKDNLLICCQKYI